MQHSGTGSPMKFACKILLDQLHITRWVSIYDKFYITFLGLFRWPWHSCLHELLRDARRPTAISIS